MYKNNKKIIEMICSLAVIVGLSISTLNCSDTPYQQKSLEEIEIKVPQNYVTGKVVRVKDGDTIVVLNEENKQVTIRLKSIDCPERKQAYGKKAKEFVINQIAGKQVEVLNTSLDRYGRTIGFVYYESFLGEKLNLSEELLKMGLAWHYTKYSDSEWLQELEDIARNLKNGLWKEPNPIAPWKFRKLDKK